MTDDKPMTDVPAGVTPAPATTDPAVAQSDAPAPAPTTTPGPAPAEGEEEKKEEMPTAGSMDGEDSNSTPPVAPAA